MGYRVGILGLQGDFALHQKSMQRLGAEAPIVRRPEQLRDCDGLILPGGESTTFLKLLNNTGLFDAIRTFADSHAVFGTCAGMIMVAGSIVNDEIDTLRLIDLIVERNASIMSGSLFSRRKNLRVSSSVPRRSRLSGEIQRL